jgi:dTDP-4-dehydrorhamnose reductase
MRKIFITGASGLLGSKLMAIARDEFEVMGQYNQNVFSLKGCDSVQLDLRDFEKVSHVIEQFEPDFLVHASALRDIDYCEEHREEATQVNVEATRVIADICKQIGTKLLYVSTDVVFDGTRTDYKTTDEPGPASHYARTKHEGEKIIMENPENMVARISFLYGWNVNDRRLNFVTWLLNNLKLGDEVELFTDQYRNGTYMDDAARVFLAMYMRGLSGIYHVASHNCLNRYEMGELVCEVFGYDTDQLKAGTSDSASWQVKRPKNCCMDVSRIEEDLEINLLTFREGLLEMKRQEEDGVLF